MTHPAPQPTPPLWRVMYEAYEDSMIPKEALLDPGVDDHWLEDRYAHAAALRAIEAELRKKFPSDPREMRARQWLLDEANRAERGEE